MSDKKMLGYMYDFYNDHVLHGQNADISYYKNQIKNYNAKKVLVVGAGTGRVAIPLSKIAEIDALDFDKERLEILHEKCNKIKTIWCDIKDYQTNEIYDVIIFPYSTFQFSNSKEKANKILEHLKCIINNKTIILFDVSESFNTKTEKNKEFLFSDYCSVVSDNVNVFYNSKRYKKFIEFEIEYKLEKNNLNLLEHERYYYYDKEMYNELFKQNNYNLIKIDYGYGEGFYHKHIYHVGSNDGK